MSFDRFSEKPPRRENRFDGRPSRFEDRGFKGEGRGQFEGRGRFSDRNEESGGERRFGFGKKPAGFKRFGEDRRDGGFSRFSGPRMRAAEKRRFSDRTAFVQTATVRLAPDVAKYFKDADSVNEALRRLIQISALVKAHEDDGAREEQAEGTAQTEETECAEVVPEASEGQGDEPSGKAE